MPATLEQQKMIIEALEEIQRLEKEDEQNIDNKNLTEINRESTY